MRDTASAAAARELHVARYLRGKVTATSSTVLTVDLDDGSATLKLPFLLGPAYAVNDVVLIGRDATGPVVLGRLGAGAAPSGEVVKPPTTTAPRQRTVVVRPTSTGSYRSSTGWRSGDEVRQGDWNSGYGINQGAAFYGRTLRSLDANLSKPRSITVRYTRTTGGVFGAQTPTFHTLAQSSRPGGAPTRLTSAAGTSVAVNRTASWKLPAGMADELLDGSAGGLGIYVAGSSPYIVLKGKSDAPSFTLSVTYTPNS